MSISVCRRVTVSLAGKIGALERVGQDAAEPLADPQGIGVEGVDAPPRNQAVAPSVPSIRSEVARKIKAPISASFRGKKI
jgi:hypothetical protein